MADRTPEQILEQAVHAVACVAFHYGPGLNEEGRQYVRDQLSGLTLFTDSSFRVDWEEGEPFIDFHERIIWPDGWEKLEPGTHEE